MMNNAELTELQETRRKNLGMSCGSHSQQAELAAIYDCEPSYISNMINGRKTIGEKTARKLEKCLNKPIHWIDTPQWLKALNGTAQLGTNGLSSITEKPKTYKNGNKYYPRVVGTARCGDQGYYMDLEGGDGYLEFDTEPGAIAIRIKGHSMHPAIREGWYVVIEPNKTPTIGEYVLAKFKDGKKMVKELIQVKTDGYLLLSVNGDERITASYEDLEDIQPITAIVPPSKHKEF
jgi:phage repressor protein C with HTH and peptisase S24 domain